MSTVACLLVPDLPLAVERTLRPAGADAGAEALVVVAEGRVVSASVAAQRRHVRPGQPLREALARAPLLAVAELRPARVAREAQALAAAFAAVSPLVEPAAPGEVYADLRGTEALYPDRQALARVVLAAAPGALGPQLGIAPTRFAALVAARRAPPGAGCEIAEEEQRAALAEVPTGWLPLPAESLERLGRLGLHRCGDLARMPRHAVEAQFGPAGGLAWLAARGRDPRGVLPRPHEPQRVVEHVQMQPPLASREAVVRSTEQLLGRALRQPHAAQRVVRVLHLRTESDDERTWERTQTLKEPTADRDRLWTALRAQLERAEFPGPIARLELELEGLGAERGRQAGLFRDHRRRREQLDEMVRHLKVRYGRSPVGRVVEVEPWSRIPERRHALMDYDP